MDHIIQQLSQTFDQDFGQSDHHHLENQSQPIINHDYNHNQSNEFLSYQDPLKHAYQHQFQPMNLNVDKVHFAHPHQVDGYVKSDGTAVKGYFRDGDGNTDVNRSFEMGGGYYSSNPDGDLFNNLK